MTFPSHMSKLSSVFRWRTKDGRSLTLDEMGTTHIFNSMKMLFNHIAEAYGGQPVWYNKQYADYRMPSQRDARNMAHCVAMFVWEIRRRGDLPQKYQWPYQQIMRQLFENQKLKEHALEAPPEPRLNGIDARVKNELNLTPEEFGVFRENKPQCPTCGQYIKQEER